jgi:hypothetical protein
MSAIVKGPNPLFWIGHNVIVIGRKRIRPQNILKKPRNIIKVVITTQNNKSALPVKRHSHTCQTYIKKEASTSLRHTLTCSLRDKFKSCSWRSKREREVHLWERTLCTCLSYLLELYWLSIIRKFCWIFFP